MDLLIKKNIIRKNRIIIDVGEKYMKILAVRYEHGRVIIHSAHKLDVSGCFFEGELSDVHELVKRISAEITRNRLNAYTEIVLSLPSNMASHKLIQVKNVKPKDLEKHIQKQNIIFSKFNSITCHTDWAYLGKHERNEETVLFCMIASVNKSHLMPILNEFDKRNLKIAGISFPTYNLTCLSDLYRNGYEHPGTMLLDFGQTSTRIIVEYEGAIVYTREINIGFQTFVDSLVNAFGNLGIPDIIEILTKHSRESPPLLTGLHNTNAFFDLVDKLISDWQNELIRIIQMCNEEAMPITKIVCVGTMPYNMLSFFEQSGIATELFKLTEPISGNGYTIIPDANIELDELYGNAVGIAISTMQ
jgi:Tfp pilus assembly PilM family ATPase